MRCIQWGFLLLLTFLCGSAFIGRAEPVIPAGGRYLINSWETEAGLPQNSITAMVQSPDGYLWLGTLNGLVRFDGLEFTVYDESNTPELKSPIVNLFADSATNLWIGTERNGVVLVKPQEIVHLPIGVGSREQALAGICEDQHRTIWLYTRDGQLWRYTAGQTTQLWPGADRPAVYRTIVSESTGLLWIGSSVATPTGIERHLAAFRPAARQSSGSTNLPDSSREALSREHAESERGRLDYLLASRDGGHWRLVDGRIQKWRGTTLLREFGPYPWQVKAACEDQEGNLVIGTLGGGVHWLAGNEAPITLSTNNGLSNNFILSLLTDREGGLWIGTDGGGLHRAKRQVFELLEDTRGIVVQSVCEGQDGGIWVGTFGIGLGYWLQGSWLPFPLPFRLPYVRSAFVDNNSRVWAGTPRNGLYQLSDGYFQRVSGPEIVQGSIAAIYQERGGGLWFGTDVGLAHWNGQSWRTFTSADGLASTNVQTLAEDPQGNLWIGSLGRGLSILSNGKFRPAEATQDLPGEDISALFFDADGVLWVGTPGRGLARFAQGKWTAITKRHGLSSNSIGYLLEDELGWLWIGSNSGLMRVKKSELNDCAEGKISSVNCRAYNKQDGLPTGECSRGSQPGAWRSRTGRLWFPTIKGLVSVHPAELKPNPYPPAVKIEQVLLEGRPVTGTGLSLLQASAITIPPGNERLEIQYTGLNFSAPDRTRFRYRLEGHESAWTEAGGDRVARYSKLPPGTYQFHVTAANEDGLWNEAGAVLALTIQPPFWRTWWFLTLTGAMLLGAIVLGVHFVSTSKLQRQLERMRQEEALERERARIARDLHDQLGASLTQVALLGEMAEADKDLPAEVEEHARQISQTARQTTRVLDEIVWTVNPSNDTLEGLVNYVCKHAQEYLETAGVRYRLEAPPQLPPRQLLPDVRHNMFLACQEAITNVVKHAHASEVKLRLALEGRQFRVEIQDNGRGIAALDSKSTRNGLKNMRKRMEDIGGSFSLDSAPSGGTRVSFIAPVVE